MEGRAICSLSAFVVGVEEGCDQVEERRSQLQAAMDARREVGV
jgi:hypothetical protein